MGAVIPFAGGPARELSSLLQPQDRILKTGEFRGSLRCDVLGSHLEALVLVFPRDSRIKVE